MRREGLYLEDILTAADAIAEFVSDLRLEPFEKNRLVRSAVVDQLTIIGDGFSELVTMGFVDVLQPDIAHVGGVTALWKVGALAEGAGIKMAPHACEGPIGGIASLHVDAAMPNFLIQEICGAVQSGERDKVWQDLMGFPAMRMVGGRYPLPQGVGLGFELNEAALKKYPFQGTRPFPTAFHPDGAVVSI